MAKLADLSKALNFSVRVWPVVSLCDVQTLCSCMGNLKRSLDLCALHQADANTHEHVVALAPCSAKRCTITSLSMRYNSSLEAI
ncbi:uncharacterized protein PHALS_12239 [Plasmopara halstedii]|uniref:Uncharacterized protein n=1 Tax=Plasmopara halstedii TaxID=4781 RepID=A0A0P1ALY4_PLAHL|nr:uncharacterized protein PHALS_12239 [Plasmopara halstedii]CEG41927.1 hypothetical protein PHALS_12239 [Plasmopara halstedii]|eukprot:XP_024578296.1 hypothetical protein PHALS_12239 [Plasmopara halstedii]